MSFRTDDVRIRGIRELNPPVDLLKELQPTEDVTRAIHNTRQELHEIIHGQSNRLVVVVGPCSIHDVDAALEYAARLKEIAKPYRGQLLTLMRVYFEKPRTTVGWKGLINDPFLDESFSINEGIRRARKLLLDLANMGLLSATEFLDMITPQYIADLIVWGAIGARTTESQSHRQLASGLSCPVGFKNGTDGNVRIAIDAIRAAAEPHHFLSVTKTGHAAIVETNGNPDCHVILRGGKLPNFDEEAVSSALDTLRAQKVPDRLMIDCSHANSQKHAANQTIVAQSIAEQIEAGQTGIFGVMIESNIVSGRQDLIAGKPLTFGQSITDECIDIPSTARIFERLAEACLKSRT
ncbi:3-deoxy-7-phosphoheptulonate synthase [Bryobacter aggregatus]|uniref:3-deoxy-7-phosphoheptulonate synthase n=1 Tax=Bryobacter aggregatus TaxID=360054 RepID=UPI0004E14247|nr:3-deoxy-7-phosphoheptulonate synthase [Bryobacter aggregatus]